jgi:tetratricopeptide (TPR) repeat protein
MPEEHYKKAQKLYKDKNYNEAILELDKAIEINPDYAESYLLRGKYKMTLRNIKSGYVGMMLAWKENYKNAYNDFETAAYLFLFDSGSIITSLAQPLSLALLLVFCFFLKISIGNKLNELQARELYNKQRTKNSNEIT